MSWLGHLHHPAGFSQWKLRPGWIWAKLSFHQSLQNYCTVFYSLNQVIPKKSRYKMQGPTTKQDGSLWRAKKNSQKLFKEKKTYPKWNYDYETHGPGFLKTASLQEVVPPSLDSTDSGLWGRREDTPCFVGETGTLMDIWYPLVNIQKTMERSTVFNG